MGDGLKQVWGLNDPKGPPSTAQADQFKASYQAILNAVNTALQYTVTNAEKPKHNEKAGERDQLNSAYQAVIVKIDPSNPAAAEAAIKSALAAANAASQAIAAFKADVEKDVAAWSAQEPSFVKAMSMIGELEAWGHKLAETLRGIVKKIQDQVNNKVLKPAIQAVIELMQKLQPIYDEYLKQKAAKEKYDPAVQALMPKLPTECRFQKLASQQQDIIALQGLMEAQANDKEYVAALELEAQLVAKVDAYSTALEGLERQKKAYEDALATLQPNLAKATAAPPHQKLADKRTEIDTEKGEMESCATSDDFEQALQKAGDLSTKTDAYLAAVDELEKQKKAYEDALAKLQPNLTKAVEAAQHEKLADKRKEIDTGKSEMESCATSEDFEQALQKANDLSTKVDAYVAAVDQLEKQKIAYDTAMATLQPKLQSSCKSEHQKLEPLEQEMLTIQTEMEAAAKTEDYDRALQLQSELTTKVDEYAKAVEDLEKAKEVYEQGLAALQPKLGEASQSKAQFADLEPIQTEMATIQKEMEAAAKAEDYENAQRLLGNLDAKVKEYFAAIEKKKAEYEKARAAAQAKVDDCMVMARSYDSLKADQVKVGAKKTEMEAKATAEDYDAATKLAAELDKMASEYLTKAAEAQKKYDEKAAKITKDLDAADKAAQGGADKDKRSDVARDLVNNQLTQDEIKFLPTEVRNRLMAELREPTFTDENKAATDKLYSVRYLDPEFEKIDKQKRAALIKKLEDDHEIVEARDKWPTMSKEDRLKIMKKVAQYHGEAYDTDPSKVTVVPKDTEPTKDATGKVTGWNNGVYSDTGNGTGKIDVNTNSYWDATKKQGVKFNDFDLSLDLMTHESGHRYQELLAKKVKDGTLKKGDPEYNQAVTFQLNDGYYTEKDPPYADQPDEAHSRISAKTIQDAGIGKKKH